VTVPRFWDVSRTCACQWGRGEHMRRASEIVLDGFPLLTDAVVVKYPDRYSDKRGKDFWSKIMSLL
jgi:hypothetical protein